MKVESGYVWVIFQPARPRRPDVAGRGLTAHQSVILFGDKEKFTNSGWATFPSKVVDEKTRELWIAIKEKEEQV